MAPPGAVPPKKGPKAVFKLDSPFTTTTIPHITDKDQEILLDMLCNLLAPIGRHRAAHTTPSKGRASRKRKRKAAATSSSPSPPVPPPPAPSAHLTIGLNATTRHLEALAASSPPSEACTSESTLSTPPNPTPTQPQPLSLVVIPHPHPPSSLIHAHIPTLVALSSPSGTEKEGKSDVEAQYTRLVALPSASEARLASALHVPRLSALGIVEGAPGADALVEFVRQKVGRVEVGWLKEAGLEGEGGAWRGVKVRFGGEGMAGKETD